MDSQTIKKVWKISNNPLWFFLGLGLVHGDDYEYEGDDSQDFSEVGSIQGDDANSPNKKVRTVKVCLFWQGYKDF